VGYFVVRALPLACWPVLRLLGVAPVPVQRRIAAEGYFAVAALSPVCWPEAQLRMVAAAEFRTASSPSNHNLGNAPMRDRF